MNRGQSVGEMKRLTANDGTLLLLWSRWAEWFPWVSAGFSTRIGGVSTPPWNSLNCGLHVGDNDADVIENRRRIAEAAGFDFGKWTCAEQVHGADVAVVSMAETGLGRRSRSDAIPSKDALITDTPGVMLTAFYADCVPIWLVDPVRKAVGLAHAGWRGTALHVAAAAIRSMQQVYGSQPHDIYAAIGPSIRGCCYEVDQEVVSHFSGYKAAISASSSPGRYMLDLAKINRQKLTEAGIMANRIELCEYCTGCRTDLFFSHRKEKGRTGRMTAWIARKS